MVLLQLFGLIPVGFGLFFAYGAVKTYRISDRRDTFEPVTAQVRDSKLDKSISDTGGSPSYRAKITYEYTVDGETYDNDNLYPGPGYGYSSAKDEQEEIVNEYPEGETVEAYYDPTDPSTSFLENESRKRQALIQGILGGCALLLGLGMIIVPSV